jgi:hypothetical protein
MLANSGALALALLSAGCATVYEAQILELAAAASTESPPSRQIASSSIS